MKKIIIDTDPGHDDAMAIMLAVKSSKLDVMAITTVAGNSTIKNTTRNARYVLGLLEMENIPVHSGASRPLLRPLIKAVVHGDSGLAGIDPTNPPCLTGDAPDRIAEIVKHGGVTLVTIGPLTNVATAMLRHPKEMNKLDQIVTMGGTIRAPGNKNRVAEFNIFVDPEAADIVMRFPVKKTLVPLDACNHVRFQLADFSAIQNKHLREPLLDMARPYIRNIAADLGVKAALMYDPLAVFYLLEPKACVSRKYNVEVETKGELTRGMTVADLRQVKDAEPNVTVVEQVDERAFRDQFVAILSE
ncbi:nucleoside hydrolase [archaeon]|nr:nucleoside hydrolase [archaeon]